jgi:hypothetical protein
MVRPHCQGPKGCELDSPSVRVLAPASDISRTKAPCGDDCCGRGTYESPDTYESPREETKLREGLSKRHPLRRGRAPLRRGRASRHDRALFWRPRLVLATAPCAGDRTFSWRPRLVVARPRWR